MPSPLETLQQDCLDKLNSETFFATVTVKSLRKMQIAKEFDAQLIFMTPKAGKLGVGVVIGMPNFGSDNPNTPGPYGQLTLPIRIYEHPTFNLDAASGSLLSAETVAMQVIQLLHRFGIEAYGSLYFDRDALKPILDAEAGIICYEATAKMQLAEADLSRTGTPNISAIGLQVTLTNISGGASVYYTVDQTFPGPGNAAALVYAAPFNVISGTVVRWAAYGAGLIGSDCGRATIT